MEQNQATPQQQKLILVIDNSMSMNGQRIKTCVDSLILNLDEFNDTIVQLYTFNEYKYKYKNQHYLPTEKDVLIQELTGILCSGSTALYDTLCEIQCNENDYIFLLTDGDDTSSKKFNREQYEEKILGLVNNKKICMIKPADSGFQSNNLSYLQLTTQFSQEVNFDNQSQIENTVSLQLKQLKSNMSSNSNQKQ